MQIDILNLIYDSITEVNQLLKEDDKNIIVLDENSAIYGTGSSLDSIGLVHFITSLEDKIENLTGNYISLADENAMSLEQSPFKSVKNLKDYLEKLLSDSKN